MSTSEVKINDTYPPTESSYGSLQSQSSEESERVESVENLLKDESTEVREFEDGETPDSSNADYIVSYDNINAVEIEMMEHVRSCKREVKEGLSKMKGRINAATYENDCIHINHVRDHVSKKLVVMEYEFQLKEPDLSGPPRIRAVWLNQDYNMTNHNAESYETKGVHNGVSVQQLVVRRGIPFILEISFDRPFNTTKHCLTIILQFGQNNVCSSPSMICLRVNDGLKPNTWSAGILASTINLIKPLRMTRKAFQASANILNQNKIQIQINSPSNAIIGKCMVTFDTAFLTREQREGLLKKMVQQRQQAEKRMDVSLIFEPLPTIDDGPETDNDLVVMRYFHTEPIYMLFNPWKKEDQTYLEKAEDLNEYVKSDQGFIYVGTKMQPKVLRWNFSQYDNTILNTALYTLDVAFLNHETRFDAANIVRSICDNIATVDSSGIIAGNWSGSYLQGRAPAQWLGTLPILNQFTSTKSPVKFGHCYTFAAVATSLCRSLGIPCRCVTNYSSAHDCDGTAKVSMHWGCRGEPIDELNPVNFWSYHVWCEAYLKRIDLVMNDYSGWQAFDPTPQDTHYGVSCAGPCPVEAIRLGDLNVLYGTKLLFSEIHAHHFHWILQENGQWRVIVQPTKAGTKILTHDPIPKEVTEKDICIPDYPEKRIEAMDILDNYKIKEGTVLERQTMERADSKSVSGDVFDKGDGDIKFVVCQGECMAGKIISVVLAMQNLGTEERTIDITLTLYSSYYTGLSRYKIKTQSYSIKLASLQKDKATIKVVPDDYCWYMTDYYTFKICAMAIVSITDQIYCTCDDFCLIFPDVEFELEETPAMLELQNTVRIRWFNPMPIDLMNCNWTIEGQDLISFTSVKSDDMEPLSIATTEVSIFPRNAGMLTLLASFYSEQTGYIRGHFKFEVQERDLFPPADGKPKNSWSA